MFIRLFNIEDVQLNRELDYVFVLSYMFDYLILHALTDAVRWIEHLSKGFNWRRMSEILNNIKQ